MKILVVSATETEISPLLSAFEAQLTNLSPGIYLVSSGLMLDFLITGVGMAATTYHLTRQIMQSPYDIVVNAGICGSFDEELQLGEVVNVAEDLFPEIGAESRDGFLTAAEAGLFGPDDFPYTGGVLKSRSFPELVTLRRLKKVSGITVNTVHGREDSIRRTRALFNPQTESMEGAAVFYVCLSEKVPCIQLRAVSNYVKVRDKNTWDIPLAIENLNKIMELLLKEMLKKEAILG